MLRSASATFRAAANMVRALFGVYPHCTAASATVSGVPMRAVLSLPMMRPYVTASQIRRCPSVVWRSVLVMTYRSSKSNEATKLFMPLALRPFLMPPSAAALAVQGMIRPSEAACLLTLLIIGSEVRTHDHVCVSHERSAQLSALRLLGQRLGAYAESFRSLFQ